MERQYAHTREGQRHSAQEAHIPWTWILIFVRVRACMRASVFVRNHIGHTYHFSSSSAHPPAACQSKRGRQGRTEPNSLRSSKAMTSAQMKPASKSVWMTPAPTPHPVPVPSDAVPTPSRPWQLKRQPLLATRKPRTHPNSAHIPHRTCSLRRRESLAHDPASHLVRSCRSDYGAGNVNKLRRPAFPSGSLLPVSVQRGATK